MTDQSTHQLQEQHHHHDQTRPNEDVVELTKANALINELHDCVENKTQGETGFKRRRNLVYANKFEIQLSAHQISTGNSNNNKNNKNNKNSKTTPETLEVISWRLNEFEYSKGTLPSLARGLFTYKEQPIASRRASRSKQSLHNEDTPPESSSASSSLSTAPSSTESLNRILIRGYDKFFNVGEVDRTKLENLQEETMGPYEVTLKENGCIIFMAGLPPSVVGPQGGCVVSSKHSLGSMERQLGRETGKAKTTPTATTKADTAEGEGGETVNAVAEGLHPVKGREWLERNLARKGKTLQEFGLWLWNQNLTAVAELCDDSFEEHILEYTGERAGLYLHGLNKNTAEFQTLPSELVQQAAEDWGFQRVDYITKNSFQEVMDFAEKIRNAGEYDNRAVEGFVIRSRRKDSGQVQFFKIKYDEPYLMYREWREITKHLWSIESKREALEQKQRQAAEAKAKAIAEAKAKGKKKEDGTEKKKSGVPAKSEKATPEPATARDSSFTRRMRYPLTRPYVDFVRDLMKTQPELFSGYNHNHGIIAIRDMFIKYWEAKSTLEQEALLTVNTVSSSNKIAKEDFQRTVIVPIATIGCGKTTVSVSLSKLFGWTHVSSDDFQHIRKSPGQKFLKEIVNQLRRHTVVIADRNNHEYLHREKLMNAVLEEFPKTRFVALYWSHDDLPTSKIHELEVERVKNRGSNHQNLTPQYCPEYEYVINTFLKSFNPLNPMIPPDSKFSNVVESKFGEESLIFVKRIVQEFAIPTLGAGGLGNHSIPSDEEIEEAVRFAREDWKPARVESGEAEKFHKDRLLIEAQASKENILSKSNKTKANTASNGNGVSTSIDDAPRRTGRSKQNREPKYLAVSLTASSVLHFLEEQFEERDLPIEISSGHITGPKDETWQKFREQLQTFKANHRIGLYQHATLIHTTARKQPNPQKAKRAEEIWQHYMEELAAGLSSPSSPSTSTSASLPSSPLATFTTAMAQALPATGQQSQSPTPTTEETAFIPVTNRRGRKSAPSVPATSSLSPVNANGEDEILSELHGTVTVDYLVWTERIMILRVCNARRTKTGKAFETSQPMLHVTVGTADDQVKPYESNDVLRQWNERMKHANDPEYKIPSGPEVYSIKLDRSKDFTGHLKAMMF
ncbi:hypothetical protein BGZ83_005611 [Gryganskiella cystojenkinii]|nr:hypothetical protein BGZ83_005611 [Gryganskiella cystojenkinii]